MKKKLNLSDWLVGSAVTLFFLMMILTGILDFTRAPEMKTFDLMAKIEAPGVMNSDIELVVITDDDITELGQYPWPRHILAQGVQNLSLAGAKVIALDLTLEEPEESEGLKAVRRLKESFEGLGLAQEGEGLEFYKKLSDAMTSLDNDLRLATAIEKAGNVVLPVRFDVQGKGHDQSIPDFISKHAYKKIGGLQQGGGSPPFIALSRVKTPLPSFAEVAAGLGHINLFPDQDGTIRSQIHVLRYLDDIFFPSFPIAIVKAFKNLSDEDISVAPSEGIRLRDQKSPVMKVPAIDQEMRTLIYWYQGPGVAFHQTPFNKVYKNEVQTSLFRDKIVIIGLTASGKGDHFAAPISQGLPGAEIMANSVADILNQRFFTRPHWISFMELAAILLFGLFVACFLPRMETFTGALTTMGLLIGYIALGAFLFFFSHIWVKITPPVFLLIIGYIVVILKSFMVTEGMKGKARLGLPEKESDSSVSGKGISDIKLTASSTAQDVQGSKKDAESVLDKAASQAENVFGNYEVLRELDQRPTGMLYEGKDMKTGRIVAIKALNLSKLDVKLLPDYKDRFFRRIASLALLSHSNIAQVHDCGEQPPFLYIITEYLEGENIERFTKKGSLLPIREALEVIAIAAEGLEYTHSRKILHQNISPSKIIRLSGSGEVKLTGFGFADTLFDQRNRRHPVVGEPLYMAPEQLLGHKLDGRTDIFSLGVVLFEMLVGRKPFLNAKGHPSLKAINPSIPLVVERIVHKALEKNVKRRYQQAGLLASHLRKVTAKLDEIEARKQHPLQG